MQTTAYRTKARGFTLLELIIVIAILAVLSVAVILVINPAETLRRGRDATRLSDLSNLTSAIGLYLVDQSSSADINGSGADTDVWTTRASGNITDPVVCGSSAVPRTYTGSAGSTDGTGWLPVNFGAISSGSPISSLPIDPTNTVANVGGVAQTDFLYIYRPTDTGNKSFELDANLESTLYSNSGTQDKETNDGGDNVNVYETGTNLTKCNAW